MVLFLKIKVWYVWFMIWCILSEGVVFLIYLWEVGCDNSLDWDSFMVMINLEGVGEYLCRDILYVDLVMCFIKDEYDWYLWLVYCGCECCWNEEEFFRDCFFMVVDLIFIFILLCVNKDFLFMMNVMGMDILEVDVWFEWFMDGV